MDEQWSRRIKALEEEIEEWKRQRAAFNDHLLHRMDSLEARVAELEKGRNAKP